MTISKAIILSAGQGSRLLPLTRDVPKCMIDLNGRTLLGWQVAALVANGISDIVVVTGFRT
ncbi:MAG: sugar phosphate nucleotidyltransferase, partial [Sphingobium sp.]